MARPVEMRRLFVSVLVACVVSTVGVAVPAGAAGGAHRESDSATTTVTVAGTLRAMVVHDEDRGEVSTHVLGEGARTGVDYAVEVDGALLPITPVVDEPDPAQVGGEVTVDVDVPVDVLADAAPAVEDTGELTRAQDVSALTKATNAVPLDAVVVDAERPVVSASITAAAHHVTLVTVRSDGKRPSDSLVRGTISDASRYWSTATSGVVRELRVTGSYSLTYNGYCSASPWSLWDQAMSVSGFDGSLARHHLVVVGPECSGETLGVGTIGAGLSTGGLLAIYGPSSETLIHEMGHNFSLGHSNLAGEHSTSSGSTRFPSYEYLGFYSPMAGGVGDVYATPALDTAYQHLLKVAPAGRLTTVPSVGKTVTLTAVGSASGVQGATFVDPHSGYRAYVEYRSGLGVDRQAFYAVEPEGLTSYVNTVLGAGVRVSLLDPHSNDVITFTSPTTPRYAALLTKGAPGPVRNTLVGWGGGYTVQVNSHTETTANVTITPGKSRSSIVSANSKAHYGSTPKVSVGVDSIIPATGTVEAYVGGKKVASKALPTSGVRRTTLNLPRTLAVGKHTVELKYTGSSRVYASTRKVTVTVSKAPVVVKTAVKNAHIKKKPTLAIRVAANAVPTGKVQVNVGGKKYRTLTLTKGRATVTLPRGTRIGKQKIAVIYKGDKNHTSSILRRTYTVTKQPAAISGLKGGTRTVTRGRVYKDTFTVTHTASLQRRTTGSWSTVKTLKAGKHVLKHRAKTTKTVQYRVVIKSTSTRTAAKKTVTLRVKK